MKTLGGLVLSAVTYLLVGLLLVLIVHAAFPEALDPQGRTTGRASLTLDLCANAVACLLAGAVAPGRTRGFARPPSGLGACAVILAIAAVSTLAFWSATPPWYNWTILATTPLFVAVGAAWRRALRRAALSTGAA